MLFVHLVRAAASRTFWTAGSKRPIRIAMIAMTTSNSINVNAGRPDARRRMGHLEQGEKRRGRPRDRTAIVRETARTNRVIPGRGSGSHAARPREPAELLS